MLTKLLGILGIIGIVLLWLLGIVLVFLLLVLFWPISYSVCGQKEDERLDLRVKVLWLMGLLRADYKYPQPGTLKVRLLGLPVYDSGRSKEKTKENQKEKLKKKSKDSAAETARLEDRTSAENNAEPGGRTATGDNTEPEGRTETGSNPKPEGRTETGSNSKPEGRTETGSNPEPEGGTEAGSNAEPDSRTETEYRACRADNAGQESKTSLKKNTKNESLDTDAAAECRNSDSESYENRGGAGENSEERENEPDGQRPEYQSWWDKVLQKLFSKYEKIKYTITKICAKIKDILENLEYYKRLLTQEETKLLFGDLGKRAYSVLKSIRPRKLTANIRFGTGSPDTTGYCMGIYGMLLPFLGNNVTVVPNFDEAECNGEFCASGRIAVFCLLRHGVRVALDKRLRRFLKRLRKQEEI